MDLHYVLENQTSTRRRSLDVRQNTQRLSLAEVAPEPVLGSVECNKN